MDVDVTKDLIPIIFVPDAEGWFVINSLSGEVLEGTYGVIYLEKPPKGSQEGPTAKCTCGGWEYGPSPKFVVLAVAAKQHADESGCRLRGV